MNYVYNANEIKFKALLRYCCRENFQKDGSSNEQLNDGMLRTSK